MRVYKKERKKKSVKFVPFWRRDVEIPSTIEEKNSLVSEFWTFSFKILQRKKKVLNTEKCSNSLMNKK